MIAYMIQIHYNLRAGNKIVIYRRILSHFWILQSKIPTVQVLRTAPVIGSAGGPCSHASLAAMDTMCVPGKHFNSVLSFSKLAISS